MLAVTRKAVTKDIDLIVKAFEENPETSIPGGENRGKLRIFGGREAVGYI